MTIPLLAQFVSPVRLLGAAAPAPLAITLPLVLLLGIAPAGLAFTRIIRGAVPLEAAQ
jgi:hypothetical protein